MLVIRAAQMQAFGEAASRDFENEMVGHVREFAPRLSQILGEPQVRAFVQTGIERAVRYHFDLRGPIRFYLELMLTFGTDFDSDPQLPWASEILSDESTTNLMFRAEVLYRAMSKYLYRVAGPDNQFAIDALRWILGARPEHLLEHLQNMSGDFSTRIVRTFGNIYPQKAECVGEVVLHGLVESANAHAVLFGVSSDLGRALIAGLMFGFGHGILTDPLYPWIASTLNQQLVADSDERARRLYGKTRAYIQHMLRHLDSDRPNA